MNSSGEPELGCAVTGAAVKGVLVMVRVTVRRCGPRWWTQHGHSDGVVGSILTVLWRCLLDLGERQPNRQYLSLSLSLSFKIVNLLDPVSYERVSRETIFNSAFNRPKHPHRGAQYIRSLCLNHRKYSVNWKSKFTQTCCVAVKQVLLHCY